MIAAGRVSLVGRMLRYAAWALVGASVAGAALGGAADREAAAQAAEPLQGPYPHAAHQRLFPLCSGCHAAAAYDAPATRYPPASLCANCHDGALLPRVRWTPPALVPAAFDHVAHERTMRTAGQSVECRDCHPVPGVARLTVRTLSAGMTCAGCHTAHRAAANCLLCHAPARASHDRDAHAGCDGCHGAVRIDSLPHTRSACLVCHEEQKAHAAPRNCVDCHPIGRGRSSSPRSLSHSAGVPGADRMV
jgi:hypothetical protein